MFFATEKNPKGPNIKKSKNFRINLSGTYVQIALPPGNCFDIPNPDGKVIENINVYDPDFYDEQKNEPATRIEVADRFFNFNGFLGQDIGTLHFCANAYRLNKNNINLFNIHDFQKHLKDHVSRYCERFNTKINNEQLKFTSNDDFSRETINSLDFIKYSIKTTAERWQFYTTAITDDCYMEFLFRFYTVRETAEPWYLMARRLEDKVMSSVTVELTESANIAKNAAT